MILVYHVISQDYVIKGYRTLWVEAAQVTILPNLVAIGTV